MATKGYRHYRGKGRGSNKLLVLLLLLILISALTFLFLQRYLVYDSDGSVRLELPFGKEAPSGPGTIPDEEVEIQREEPAAAPEPELPVLTALHGKELPYNCLKSDPSAALEGLEAVAVSVKRTDGALAWRVAFALPSGVSCGTETARSHVQSVTQSDCYTVARITALCDRSYPAAKPAAAVTYSGGGLWRDNYGRTWLDPTKEATADYLCALAEECARLGFDELLLDQLRFPIEGDLSGTALAGVDRAAAITALVEKIRAAAGSDVAVSVLLPASLETTYAFKASGLSAAVLEEQFDRVYVPRGSAAFRWVDSALSDDFDRSVRLVLTGSSAGSGSYLITQ